MNSLRIHAGKTGDRSGAVTASANATIHLIKSQFIDLRVMSRICVCADQLASSQWASEQGLRSIAHDEQ